MSSSTQLFEGQRTHPLSKEEKDAFLKKVHVKSGDKKTINDALSDAFENNLTVRQFVREVNSNHPNISFDINVVPKLVNTVGGYRIPEKKYIYLQLI